MKQYPKFVQLYVNKALDENYQTGDKIPVEDILVAIKSTLGNCTERGVIEELLKKNKFDR
ncbi:hypothetical protein [Sulfuricurvum sp.]|uniref:hypothetical protein n=1 Tax=Sulfuricurvum sp. TaxID=2025608 RepID=UPI003563901B